MGDIVRRAYMDFWRFSNEEKEKLIKQLTFALPALRGITKATQDQIANVIGVSRQTYNAIEVQKRHMSWNTYMSLILFFDYNPNSHTMIRQLDAFPTQLDECWLLEEFEETNDVFFPIAEKEKL